MSKSKNLISTPKTDSRRNEWEDAKNHQHLLKHKTILAVATRKFMQRGYADTTLADIAEELGITDKALYYYFKNKEDLAYNCIVAAQDWNYRNIRECDKLSVSGYEKMWQHIKFAVEESKLNGPMMAEMPRHLAHSKRGIELRKAQVEHQAILINWIQQGQKDGTIVKGHPVVLWNLLFGALAWMPHWAHPDSEYNEVAVDSALYLVERLLKP